MLQALAEGYFGLNWVFLVNVVIVIAMNLAIRANGTSPVAALAALGGVFAVIALLTYPQNKKIAFGKNWPPGSALAASLLMGLNSALCCGIIGYVVMQQIALGEMKKYGLKPRAFGGVRRNVVMAMVEQIRAREATDPQNPYAAPRTDYSQ